MSSFYISDHQCYSLAEAAKTLGIGRSTLFGILASGEIKALKLGNRTLITGTELARYVESLPQAQFCIRREMRR